MAEPYLRGRISERSLTPWRNVQAVFAQRRAHERLRRNLQPGRRLRPRNRRRGTRAAAAICEGSCEQPLGGVAERMRVVVGSRASRQVVLLAAGAGRNEAIGVIAESDVVDAL